MTDTEDMELLEREPPLAALGGFAAEARRGQGRLVLLGGEAGGARRRWSSASGTTCPRPASTGERATACSPRTRWGRSTTWPNSSAARCSTSVRAAPAPTSCSAPCCGRPANRDDPLGLTRREREILAELCAGQTNAAIAAKLFISVKTVDHHVSAVLAKFGAPNRNAAAARAVELNLFNERRSCHAAATAFPPPLTTR